jgi:hypothetical protein
VSYLVDAAWRGVSLRAPKGPQIRGIPTVDNAMRRPTVGGGVFVHPIMKVRPRRNTYS